MLRLSIEPVGLQEIQEGGKVNNGAAHNLRLLTSPGLAHTTDNFAPNEYRGVVNPSGLDVYKGSKQGWKDNSDCNRKVKQKVKWRCKQWWIWNGSHEVH